MPPPLPRRAAARSTAPALLPALLPALPLALLLALLSGLLAACGSDQVPATRGAELGDVVPARTVDVNGTVARNRSFLIIPTGRLEVLIGDPLPTLGADDTRAREVRDAPEGGVFLPVSWRYRPHVLDAAASVFGARQDVTVELVSDGHRYKLVPPAEDRSASDADEFFVAVEGEATDVRLDVDYAGVTQTLDLTGGTRTKGRAAGLYSLTDVKVSTSPCPDRDWAKRDNQYAQLYFYCTTTTALRTPFVDGEWAAKGHTFVVLGLGTTMDGYLLPGDDGVSTATYTVASSTDTTTLGGNEPVKVLDEVGNGGVTNGYLVFDVEGKVPRTLSVGRRYVLTLSRVKGDLDAKQELRLEARGDVRLRF